MTFSGQTAVINLLKIRIYSGTALRIAVDSRFRRSFISMITQIRSLFQPMLLFDFHEYSYHILTFLTIALVCGSDLSRGVISDKSCFKSRKRHKRPVQSPGTLIEYIVRLAVKESIESTHPGTGIIPKCGLKLYNNSIPETSNEQDILISPMEHKQNRETHLNHQI